VPDERASIVLATDTSGPMQATHVTRSRLVAAREAALDFVYDVPDQVRVGAVVFNHTVRAIESPTTQREPVRRALERPGPRGGTATRSTRAGRRPRSSALPISLAAASRFAGSGACRDDDRRDLIRLAPSARALTASVAGSGEDPGLLGLELGVAEDTLGLELPE
jgi:uncharacterized protein (DUF58 family)